jgi:nicotinamidase/pyrazinamidase
MEIVPQINRLLALEWRHIAASQDWHPQDHCSFFGQRDNLYPKHCVMGSPGAEFLPELRTERFQTIWPKGFNPDADAYALTDQHPAFVDFLRSGGVGTVVVCGLATNICCFHAATDLRQHGFSVYVVEDASAGIDLSPTVRTQEEAKVEGQRLGIVYGKTEEMLLRDVGWTRSSPLTGEHSTSNSSALAVCQPLRGGNARP